MKAKKKRSVLLLVSAILGVLYIIYSISYWTGANSGNSDAATALGAGIATALVMPHLVCSGLATLFNILGWAMNHRAFALVGGILYAVAMVLFPMYFVFVVVQVVLSFVGFAKLKKIIAFNEAQESSAGKTA